MLSRSISATLAAPMPTASARRRMNGKSRSRWARDSIFESRTPGTRRAYGRQATAAATTGPLREATPTASAPTMTVRPACQCSRSKRVEGRITRCGRRWPVMPPVYAAAPAAARSVGAALAKCGGLADSVAEEVELSATGDAVADDFDLVDPRRVEHEGPLHADAAGDAADGDGLVEPAAAHPHDGALED